MLKPALLLCLRPLQLQRVIGISEHGAVDAHHLPKHQRQFLWLQQGNEHATQHKQLLT